MYPIPYIAARLPSSHMKRRQTNQKRGCSSVAYTGPHVKTTCAKIIVNRYSDFGCTRANRHPHASGQPPAKQVALTVPIRPVTLAAARDSAGVILTPSHPRRIRLNRPDGYGQGRRMGCGQVTFRQRGSSHDRPRPALHNPVRHVAGYYYNRQYSSAVPAADPAETEIRSYK